MSEPTFYMVPYSVAATRKSGPATGRLRVRASSPADALERAAAIHSSRNVLGTPANKWYGPGAQSMSPRPTVSASTLGKAMIAAISYGEPVKVGTAPGQRDVLGVDARERKAIERALTRRRRP